MAGSARRAWIGRIAVWLLIATAASLATWLATETARAFATKPPVPLTAGLKGTWKEMGQELDSRIKAAFLPGMPVRAMGLELERQGFERLGWTDADQDHRAVRREDNFVCHQAAYIHWQVDADQCLTEIDGEYRQEGCL